MQDSIDTPGEAVSLVGALKPFSVQRTETMAVAGPTVAGLLRGAGWGGVLRRPRHVRILVNDMVVPPQEWETHRPTPGSAVFVRVLPSGGGSSGGKDPMRTVLTLAVVAAAIAAPYLAPAAWGTMTAAGGITLTGALVSGGVMVLGTALVDVISPVQAASYSLSGGRSNLQASSSSAYNIQGTQNTDPKYMPVPEVYGEHRVWPPNGAKQYTELVGDDEYLRCLFVVGNGRYALSDHQIGETPLSSFADVEMHIRDGSAGQGGLSLYSNDVYQDVLSLSLAAADGWQTRTSQTAVDELSFDIYFSSIFRVLTEDDATYSALKAAGEDVQVGDYWASSVQFEAQYRASGGAWASWGTFTVSANSRSPIRRGYRLKVTKGQYDVRWRRITADDSTGYVYDACSITALRSIKYTAPIDVNAGWCTVELRIRATSQLSGVIDQYNCMAKRYLPVWDDATETWTDTLTRSPAWAYVNVLRGSGNKRALSDARLDLPSFKAWADRCTTYGWHLDAVMDFQSTVFETLREVASVGRAAFGKLDHKFSIVEDKPCSVGKQSLTPRNTTSFEGTISYPYPRPHAVRARFINADVGYQQDELTVYDDGYDETTATVFETLDVAGIVEPQGVWKYVRRKMAASLLRHETMRVGMDVENLVLVRGDRAPLQHDVPMLGVGTSARVSSVATVVEDEGQPDEAVYTTAVTCDDTFPLEAGKTYVVKIRGGDGTFFTPSVDCTEDGETPTLTFRARIGGAVQPVVDDLVSVFEAGLDETDVTVAAIEPGPDLSAIVTVVPYVDMDALELAAEFPGWVSNITTPPNYARSLPPKPTIDSVVSDETVLTRLADGTLQSQIVVRFSWAAGAWPSGGVTFQAQFRETNGGEWRSLPYLSTDSRIFHAWPVQDRVRYDVRVRAVAASGLASDWATVESHVAVGKSTPPPDVSTLLLTNDELVWTYPSPPRDHAGFLVRYNSGSNRAWGTGTPVREGITTLTHMSIAGFSATVTFMVKAVDTAGNESTNAAYVVTALGDPITANVIETYSEAPAFGGTVANASVVADELVANAVDWWTGNNANALWSGVDATLVWSAMYAAMSYAWAWTPPTEVLGERLLIDRNTEGAGVVLEYATDSAAPVWSGDDAAAVWSGDDAAAWWNGRTGYVQWPGEIAALGNTGYYFRASIGGGTTRGKIIGLDLVVDVPDIVEEFDDLAITVAADGLRLPLTRTYRRVKGVQLTLQDDGGTAETIKGYDKSTDGPLVKAKDASGTFTTALFDARVWGY